MSHRVERSLGLVPTEADKAKLRDLVPKVRAVDKDEWERNDKT